MKIVGHTGLVDHSNIEPIGVGDTGYVRERISIAMVFGPCGDFEFADDLDLLSALRGAETQTLVPRGRLPEDGFTTNFLWGRTRDALGVRGPIRQSTGYRLDHRAFEAFRALHTSTLAGVNDTSVKAFLLFLARWSPEGVREVPLLEQRVGSAVAFRFRYDDEFLHEKQAARVAWQRRLGASASRQMRLQPSE